MMNENAFAQSQLMDQLSSRDPFQKAQAQYQMQQAPQPAQAPQPNPQMTSSSISSLMQQPPSYTPGGQSTPFTSLMSQHGIDSTGLQYNDLGRMQLQSRLSNKFGPGYDQVPDAMQVLKSFDQYRSTIPSDNAQQAQGDRTLSFLMGQS